jgi:nucleotide-binding universal stress UspA family protein
MKMLIGVDGSPGSLAAVRFAGRFQAEETDPIFLYYSPPALSLLDERRIDETTRHRVEKALVDTVFDRAKQQLPMQARPHVVTIVGSQAARHGLLVAAEEHHADLIVVGSHGARRLEWLGPGSVSRAIAHSSMLPVLIVREPAETVSGRPLRVLVTCDRTETATCPKAFIQRLAWPPDTHGEILSVYETYLGEVPEWLRETLARESGLGSAEKFEPFAEDKRHAFDQVRQWCADLPTPFRHEPAQIVEGHASRAILDRLNSAPYDLVILGARRKGPIGRLLLGSTSAAVLSQAPCSVLIVREQEHA